MAASSTSKSHIEVYYLNTEAQVLLRAYVEEGTDTVACLVHWEGSASKRRIVGIKGCCSVYYAGAREYEHCGRGVQRLRTSALQFQAAGKTRSECLYPE